MKRWALVCGSDFGYGVLPHFAVQYNMVPQPRHNTLLIAAAL